VNPTNGRTSGKWRVAILVHERDGSLRARMIDTCKHCPHADKMRLRRVPKRLKPRGYICFYCQSRIVVALPCDCPACGRKLHKDVLEMTAVELFLASRENGLILNLKFVPKDGSEV